MVFDRLFSKAHQQREERNPTDLRVGDAVSVAGDDFTVEQRHELRGDGGDVWWKYLLQSTERRLWLDVDEDQGLTLTTYELIRLHVPIPVPSVLSVAGKAFTVEEHGFANDVMTKRSGTSAERVEYWYLSSEDGGQLAIWRLGDNPDNLDATQQTGTVEVGLGQEIKSYQLTIYQS
ncbi:MAG: DUF4178 domain-containing protein [Chloroflexi bacterium]|nr:DUF4178 domain-containing protein [Chloroflexota bacterium]